ncbi:hypothetical protein F5890DRAFT_656503 [Lentinula detonsa]|uniref:Uncharacterized protein n=1 Tax=Lentinula detonsa TaxID=2804962 RepID=A0AA38Q5A0_9AGAR|nr:hypothetical protein F5890DRAFT_656503 [Lentinula detonsa]
MQVTFFTLTSAIITAISFINSINAAAVELRDGEIVTQKKILEWISTTDANLTFIGDPITKRNTEIPTVVYCSVRTGGVCGGTCTVYRGGPACLRAPGTNCISATQNVGICGSPGCGGRCTQLFPCQAPLGDGFCYTPRTESINVGF